MTLNDIMQAFTDKVKALLNNKMDKENPTGSGEMVFNGTISANDILLPLPNTEHLNNLAEGLTASLIGNSNSSYSEIRIGTIKDDSATPPTQEELAAGFTDISILVKGHQISDILISLGHGMIGNEYYSQWDAALDSQSEINTEISEDKTIACITASLTTTGHFFSINNLCFEIQLHGNDINPDLDNIIIVEGIHSMQEILNGMPQIKMQSLSEYLQNLSNE